MIHRSLLFLAVTLTVLLASTSYAIPAFARMYGTSCSTCHIDFPKLNDFGKAFKDAGFKFPKDDESMIKIPPVMLGAPANAELWPKAIWPGTIPGIPPIGLRMTNYFQYTGTSSRKFASLTPAGTLPPFVPTTDFETGLFSLFTAGNFGSDIAFWVDDDISVSGANANGGTGRCLSQVRQYRPPAEAAEELSQSARRPVRTRTAVHPVQVIWISPYDIYTQANIGAMNSLVPLQQFVNNQFTMADGGQGIELSGGLHTGGYNYSIAFINQNTSGVGQDSNPGSPYVPQATGSNNGGLGVASDANFKDIYATFNYRFNLERDKESRECHTGGWTDRTARPHLSEPRHATIFTDVRCSDCWAQAADGTSAVVTAREPFYRVGGNMTFNYRCCLQFNALYMYGHDYNLLPIDADGNLIPSAESECSAVPVGFIHSTPATFSGGFVDVEWLAYPWMYVMIRYDGVNSTSDRINGLIRNDDAPASPVLHSTGRSVRPAIALPQAVQFLIHANIKASFEYQFRPSQSVVIATNPLTGLPVALNPFHTNTLVLGLTFAY